MKKHITLILILIFTSTCACVGCSTSTQTSSDDLASADTLDNSNTCFDLNLSNTEVALDDENTGATGCIDEAYYYEEHLY